MRVLDNGSSVVLWASANDTYDWATKPYAAWPGSELSGKRFCASFDTNGLCELTVDGKYLTDVSGDELSAICSDLLGESLAKDHPCWFVAVGQFRNGATR